MHSEPHLVMVSYALGLLLAGHESMHKTSQIVQVDPLTSDVHHGLI